MVNTLTTYRVYANTLSSIENLPNANLDNELHIVLPFARDYDSGDANTTGQFKPYFDTANFTADRIKAFRKNSPFTQVKFFLSIGGRDSRFPFSVTSADESQWIKSAIQSLTDIVNNYGFDGVDVYYEHILPAAQKQFANSMFEVISNLKLTKKVISSASMTVSSPLDNRYYELFTKGDKRFDYVVYQTHNQTTPISNIDDIGPIFDELRYPKPKILAGHSDAPADWAYVTPPIFLGAIPQLLNKGIPGFSKWLVTPKDYNPEA